MIGALLLAGAFLWIFLAMIFADTEGPVWPLSLVGASLMTLGSVYAYMEAQGL